MIHYLRIYLAATIVAMPTLSLAQQLSPEAVTDAQIQALQLSIDAGCRNRGKERNDPPEKVDVFCTCMTKTLLSVVPTEIWKQVVIQANSGHADVAMQALDPYMSKLTQCKLEESQVRAQPP